MGARPGNTARTGGERSSSPGRIAVCAADETLRARIGATLELGGHEITYTCELPEELVDGPALGEPDLVVLGLAFEPFSTSTGVEQIRAALGETPLVVVASGFVGAACRRLVPGAIEGLVQEGRLEHALLPTVRAVLSRQLCVPTSLRATLVHPVFSHREKQVLELLVAGLTNGEIAAQLYLSESTVKSHLASSFRKLGVSSRAEAARCVLAPDSGLELRALARPESSLT